MPVPHHIGNGFALWDGLHFQRAHQIVAGSGQQLKLIIGRAAALGSQAFAVVAFGQQVLEVHGPASIRAHQARIACG
ncbi:hypothetical protein D3C72_2034520 [compost metagenome]